MDLAQTLALGLTGVVVVPLLQVLKRYVHVEGPAMLWISLVVSWAVAIVVVVVTGKMSLASIISDPGILLGSGGIVISVAQAVYGSIKNKLGG